MGATLEAEMTEHMQPGCKQGCDGNGAAGRHERAIRQPGQGWQQGEAAMAAWYGRSGQHELRSNSVVRAQLQA
jgi:hypothetical protein